MSLIFFRMELMFSFPHYSRRIAGCVYHSSLDVVAVGSLMNDGRKYDPVRLRGTTDGECRSLDASLSSRRVCGRAARMATGDKLGTVHGLTPSGYTKHACALSSRGWPKLAQNEEMYYEIYSIKHY